MHIKVMFCFDNPTQIDLILFLENLPALKLFYPLALSHRSYLSSIASSEKFEANWGISAPDATSKEDQPELVAH